MGRSEADQRLWFIVDELDALGEIDGLKDALSRLRKFGGRCVLALQSIGQVSGIYGRAVADTIVENCGNTLILRCSASERGGTSEFASKLIGQHQVVHTTRSQTRRPNEWLPATTTSEHLSIEPAIMASEIERLPDLEGFLKMASIPDWRRVRLAPVSQPVSGYIRPEGMRHGPTTSARGGHVTKGAPKPVPAKMNSDRLYLYVPPEDKTEVEALGARWDKTSMCWYIGSGDDRTRFSKWLPDEDNEEDEEFSITSDEAYVASATVPCQSCGSTIEVICIYCGSGTVLDEPLSKFTVSNIRAVDTTLGAQLARWATFRESYSEIDQSSCFANHCPTAARCRRIRTCIQSRTSLSSGFHVPVARQSGLHRSWGEFS